MAGPTAPQEFLKAENVGLRMLLEQASIDAQALLAQAGIDAEQRVKLSKLAWDAIGSEFGGRHELYERNYAGNIESIKVETFFAAQAAGDCAYLERLVQNCLYDYDLTGWTGPTWCGPAD